MGCQYNGDRTNDMSDFSDLVYFSRSTEFRTKINGKILLKKVQKYS